MIYTYPYQFWLLAFCKGPPRTYLCFFLRCGRLWLCTALCISLDFDLVVHPPGQRRRWHIGCRRQRVHLRSYSPDLSGVPPVHLRGVPAREDYRVRWSLPSVPHVQSLAALSGIFGYITLRRLLVQPVLPTRWHSSDSSQRRDYSRPF